MSLLDTLENELNKHCKSRNRKWIMRITKLSRGDNQWIIDILTKKYELIDGWAYNNKFDCLKYAYIEYFGIKKYKLLEGKENSDENRKRSKKTN